MLKRLHIRLNEQGLIAPEPLTEATTAILATLLAVKQDAPWRLWLYGKTRLDADVLARLAIGTRASKTMFPSVHLVASRHRT